MIDLERELADSALDLVSGGTLPFHNTSDSDSVLKYAILYGAYKGIEQSILQNPPK